MTKTYIRTSRLLLVLGLIVSMIACKKNGSSSDPVIGEPAKTEKGQPIGTAIEKVIGPEGGTLSSGNGSLTIKVPAGAVTANTNFGIQPITNTLTGNNDTKPAFRLTPEGTTFSKPVEVSMSYAAGTPEAANPHLITAAYQTAEGNWKAVPGKLNKDAHKYTFQTTHFSDWMVESALSLYKNSNVVGFGDTVRFTILGFSLGKDDLLAPLTPNNNVHNFQWRLIQTTKGKLIVNKEWPIIAHFTPVELPPNTSNIAEVSVKLSGQEIKVFDETLPNGYATFNQVTLLESVEILHESYMTGTFMDQKINITNVVALGSEGSMAITGQSGSMYINMNVFAVGPGRYPCGEFFEYGKSQAGVTVYTGPTPKQYGTTYEDCGPPRTLKYSTGSVEISQWGDAGKPVKGHYIGQVYILDGNSPNGCPQFKSHVLSVEFRAIRDQ